MEADESVQKFKSGKLKVKDITDPKVRVAAKGFLQREHPEIDFEGDFSERLLKDKDVVAAIES